MESISPTKEVKDCEACMRNETYFCYKCPLPSPITVVKTGIIGFTVAPKGISVLFQGSENFQYEAHHRGINKMYLEHRGEDSLQL